MQLSKLTFSLASLVLILALGLVFAPVSVMAHAPVSNGADPPADTHGHPEGLTQGAHSHPTITLTATDANPNVPGTQIVQGEDTDTTTLTLVFNLLLTVSENVVDNTDDDLSSVDSTPVAAGTFSTTGDIAVIDYDNNNGDVGAVTVGTPTQANAATKPREWTVPFTFTLPTPTPGTGQTQAQADTAAVAAALAAGLNFQVTVAPNLIQSDRVFGPYERQGNLEVVATFTAIPMAVPVPTAKPAATVTVAADTYHGGGRFVATFTFDATPAPTFTIDDIDAGANARVLPGSFNSVEEPEEDKVQWTAVIESLLPGNTDDIVVTVKGDNVVPAAGDAGMATVMAAAAPPTDTGDGTPTGPTATQIGSKGYAVFVPANRDASVLPTGLATFPVANMPNLANFLRTGGTIDVVVTGKANHNVIITEIMVAEDLGKRGGAGTARPEAGQWIELYNNTDAHINISDVSFMFRTGYPAPAAPANTTDRFSNTVVPGWNAETFTDALSGQTTVNAATGAVTVTKNFISLRRSYKKNANDYDDGKRLQNDGTVIGNGWDSRSWKITANSRVFLAGRIGTPGSENRPTLFTPASFTAPTLNITINEVANRSDNGNEWIELKGPAGQSLKKVKISTVTAIGTETTVYQFPDNDDVKFPSNGILLISDVNPKDNELAADLKDGVPTEGIRYRVRTLAALPNDGNFLLVLRNTNGSISDVAGHATGLSRDNPYTTLWPLAGNVGRISAKNKLEVDKVYRRARGIQGYSSNKGNGDEPAFEHIGFTGIGYDRNAANSNVNGGTPGYPNGAYINAGDDATKKVIISEIMYSQGAAGRLPQWIELQNTSATTGVDLHNWRLYIVNHDNPDFTGKLTDQIWLRGVKIPPNQTALIVSHAGRNATSLPAHRVLNVRRAEPLLSVTGFELRLEAKSNEGDAAKRQAGDKVSNLVDEARKSFTEPAWTLPSGMDENGDRVSISRKTSSKIMDQAGTEEWSWILSNEDPRLSRIGSVTSYGHTTDISSPGNTVGAVLPVSLSKFRPERLDDGTIVVRWVTESELDNAGFNILRSDTRDGEFTKLNASLIAGQGTTSERHTYKFVDTTAKPNVVYYYQIQDVSLDGDVQTLRTTHLRGNVTAAGKLTTIWGELKSQD